MRSWRAGTSIKRFLAVFCVIFALLVLAGPARADDQIVTDPLLNAALNQIEQKFPDFIKNNPELTSGSLPALELMGSKGSISFVFEEQDGQYQIDFDSLQFSATNPISANTFNIDLAVKDVALMGKAQIMVNANGQNYTLDCPDTKFTLGPIHLTAEVSISLADGISVDNVNVDFDPNSLVIDMPCLQSAAQGLTADNGQLTHGQLKKLRKALKATAQKPNSAVSQAIKLMIINLSSQITKGAAVPRSGR